MRVRPVRVQVCKRRLLGGLKSVPLTNPLALASKNMAIYVGVLGRRPSQRHIRPRPLAARLIATQTMQDAVELRHRTAAAFCVTARALVDAYTRSIPTPARLFKTRPPRTPDIARRASATRLLGRSGPKVGAKT